MTICNTPCVAFFTIQYIAPIIATYKQKWDLSILRSLKRISKTFLQHTYYIPHIFYQKYSHNTRTKRTTRILYHSNNRYISSSIRRKYTKIESKYGSLWLFSKILIKLITKLITKDCSSMSLFLIDNISQAFERMELYIFTFVRFLYIIHITRGKEKCKYCCNI